MNYDGVNETFSFVNEPDREPLSLRSKQRIWPSRKSRLVGAIALTFHALMLTAFLNFMGITQIPGLEWFTKDRLMAPRQATIPVAPQVPARNFPPVIEGPPRRLDAPPGGSSRSVRAPESNRHDTPVIVEASQQPRDQRASISAVRGSVVEALSMDLASAGALLERKGIVRGNSAFVLRSESEAKARLIALRSRAEEFNAAYVRLAEIKTALAKLAELDDSVTQINAEIAELNFQMGQYPGIWRRGILYHGMNMVENGICEELQSGRDTRARFRDTTIVPQRDTLRRQQPGRNLAEATDAFKYRRETALSALNEMREAVAATKKGYEELANDVEARKALVKVGQVNLDPSPEFLTNV
jgi:hypothetical protein